MKRALIALLLGCVTVMLASVAIAGQEQNDGASITVHIGPWVPALNHCDPVPLTNSTVITEVNDCDPATGWYTVYVLVCNGSDSLGVAGLEYGIDYDGLESSGMDIWTWTSCTDLEFPQGDGAGPGADWPDAGTGNLQTWDYTINCQNTLSEPYVPRTVIAIAGAFEVQLFGPDLFYITPRPATGYAKVGDCFGAEYDITNEVPSHLGVGAFCLGQGYNPCGAPTPVKPATWGQIKQQY